ncbi:hypothetical protein BDA96_01G297000 [Sorghum bicolor]|uniref:Uncharacterized protein n=1 Tax=Sorghum bicolor TaxID=4558 RepID=A0A921S1K2_SORBI|nr:hypothetical protein BDA96_01G297000 [Sorghum bicolor]KAG0549934.1 hypothetical protein BDA96_01G297000 [Sorghum bicolor]
MAVVLYMEGSCSVICICCKCIISWHIAPQWHGGDIRPCIIIGCMQHCCCIMENGCGCITIFDNDEPPMENACCVMQDCTHETMEFILIIREGELITMANGCCIMHDCMHGSIAVIPIITMANGCCIMHDCMHGSITVIPITCGMFCRQLAVAVAIVERARSAATRARHFGCL